MPSTMNTIITPRILPSSRQFTLLMLSAVSKPQAKKPIALRMDTVDSRPSSVVPTGMAKMFPANPVMAWTVYAKKNAARTSAFSIYATILIYVTSLQV